LRLPDALKEIGVEFERVKESRCELQNATAYLELHIEQGPVLLDLNLPLGAVLGTFGVERHAITFRGQAAHSGSTPMNRRKGCLSRRREDESGNLSHRRTQWWRLHHRIMHDETRHRHQCGRGMPRHTRPTPISMRRALARMLKEAKDASERFAQEGVVTVSWERLWQIEPVLFHRELVDLCDQSIQETCSTSHRLPSGPLHDAAEVARAGVPTVMMFVQSLHGISHNNRRHARGAS